MIPAHAPKKPEATRLMSVSPRRRLARLSPVDRPLLLLLVSLGPEAARDRLAGLAPERRDELGPLVAEIAALPEEERHALFAPPDSAPRVRTSGLNARLARERPQVARLLIEALAPGRVIEPAPARDAAFARTLRALAARWTSGTR
jgi:hypothetical protein